MSNTVSIAGLAGHPDYYQREHVNYMYEEANLCKTW